MVRAAAGPRQNANVFPLLSELFGDCPTNRSCSGDDVHADLFPRSHERKREHCSLNPEWPSIKSKSRAVLSFVDGALSCGKLITCLPQRPAPKLPRKPSQKPKRRLPASVHVREPSL